MGDQLITALAVVRPAAGRSATGEPISARNLAAHMPSAEDVRAARAGFAAAGFDVGEAVGIAFSITAPASVFEAVFGTTIHPAEGGGLVAATADGTAGTRELPLDALPADLAQRLVAVTFEPPAELFGPTSSP